jgi:hypothetical protein
VATAVGPTRQTEEAEAGGSILFEGPRKNENENENESSIVNRDNNTGKPSGIFISPENILTENIFRINKN